MRRWGGLPHSCSSSRACLELLNDKNAALNRYIWTHLRLNEVVKIMLRGWKQLFQIFTVISSNMLTSTDYILKIKLKTNTLQERTAYLNETHRCTCCLNIFTDHQRNAPWHSRASSVHYVFCSKFSPDSEIINYFPGPSNLSPVTVSLFHTNKPFQKQLPVTPERISIATLHDTVTPRCLPNVWSLT